MTYSELPAQVIHHKCPLTRVFIEFEGWQIMGKMKWNLGKRLTIKMQTAVNCKLGGYGQGIWRIVMIWTPQRGRKQQPPRRGLVPYPKYLQSKNSPQPPPAPVHRCSTGKQYLAAFLKCWKIYPSSCREKTQPSLLGLNSVTIITITSLFTAK